MLTFNLLERLEKVKKTGMDSWLACCPSHNDKTPSLAIKEVDNGTILLKCFAGCDNYSVVSAVGLELSDLFPPRPDRIKGRSPISKPFPATDILKALSAEITFLMICAGDMAKGETLGNEDMERLRLAAGRFKTALNTGGILV